MKAKLDLELHINKPAMQAELATLQAATRSAMSAGFSSSYGTMPGPSMGGMTQGSYGAYPWQAASPQELMASGVSAASPKGHPTSYLQSLLMTSPGYAGAFASPTSTVETAQQYAHLQMSQLTRASAAGIFTTALPTGAAALGGMAGSSIGAALGSAFGPIGTGLGWLAGGAIGGAVSGKGMDLLTHASGSIVSEQLNTENYLLSSGYKFGMHADLSEKGKNQREDLAHRFNMSMVDSNSEFYRNMRGHASLGEMSQISREIFDTAADHGMIRVSDKARKLADGGNTDDMNKELDDQKRKVTDSVARMSKILHTSMTETAQIFGQMADQGFNDVGKMESESKRIAVLARTSAASIKELVSAQNMGGEIGKATGVSPGGVGALATEMYAGMKEQLTQSIDNPITARGRRSIETLGGVQNATQKTLSVLLSQEETIGLNDMALAAKIAGTSAPGGTGALGIASAGMEGIAKLGKGDMGAGWMEYSVQRQDELHKMQSDPKALLGYLSTQTEAKAQIYAQTTGANMDTARTYAGQELAKQAGLSRNVAAQVGELIAQGAGTNVIDPKKREAVEKQIGESMRLDESARSGGWVKILESIHQLQLRGASLVMKFADSVDAAFTSLAKILVTVIGKPLELLLKIGESLVRFFGSSKDADAIGEANTKIKDELKDIVSNYTSDAARAERSDGFKRLDKGFTDEADALKKSQGEDAKANPEARDPSRAASAVAAAGVTQPAKEEIKTPNPSKESSFSKPITIAGVVQPELETRAQVYAKEKNVPIERAREEVSLFKTDPASTNRSKDDTIAWTNYGLKNKHNINNKLTSSEISVLSPGDIEHTILKTAEIPISHDRKYTASETAGMARNKWVEDYAQSMSKSDGISINLARARARDGLATRDYTSANTSSKDGVSVDRREVAKVHLTEDRTIAGVSDWDYDKDPGKGKDEIGIGGAILTAAGIGALKVSAGIAATAKKAMPKLASFEAKILEEAGTAKKSGGILSRLSKTLGIGGTEVAEKTAEKGLLSKAGGLIGGVASTALSVLGISEFAASGKRLWDSYHSESGHSEEETDSLIPGMNKVTKRTRAWQDMGLSTAFLVPAAGAVKKAGWAARGIMGLAGLASAATGKSAVDAISDWAAPDTSSYSGMSKMQQQEIMHTNIAHPERPDRWWVNPGSLQRYKDSDKHSADMQKLENLKTEVILYDKKTGHGVSSTGTKEEQARYRQLATDSNTYRKKDGSENLELSIGVREGILSNKVTPLRAQLEQIQVRRDKINADFEAGRISSSEHKNLINPENKASSVIGEQINKLIAAQNIATQALVSSHQKATASQIAAANANTAAANKNSEVAAQAGVRVLTLKDNKPSQVTFKPVQTSPHARIPG